MKSRSTARAHAGDSGARASHAKRGWLALLMFWGLTGVYPACSDAEFRVSAQGGTSGTSGASGSSGASGTAGNGGSSGRDASQPDSDADAQGGAAGSSSDGSAGTPSDARPDTADAQPDVAVDAPVDAPTETGPTCDAPLQYFLDADHDTYGDDGTTVRACAAPGADWVLRGGDCRDDLPEVRPSQIDYKPEGYETKNGVSFDYNCSGLEEADPGSLGAAGPCPSVGCTAHTGYLPVARAGVGVSPICGSRFIRACVINLGLCSLQSPVMAPAKRCR